MKQFEKWDKKVKVTTWSGNLVERQERKWYREQTWKAALEWVLSLPTLCDFSLDTETIYNELDIESPEAKHRREMRELNES